MRKYLVTSQGDMMEHEQGGWCRIEDVMKAIADEPEYPGEAPPILCSILNQAIEEKDLDLLLHSMRETVRLTKECIASRINSV